MQHSKAVIRLVSTRAATEAYLRHHHAGERKVATYAYWLRDLQQLAMLHDITTDVLYEWQEHCIQAGNSPATIKAKMSMVSGLFDAARLHCGYSLPKPRIPYPKVPRQLKWWLTPDYERKAIEWCEAHGETDLLDYLRWTIETGLRVEETLACEREHFINLTTERPELSVPGTKTADSQATIPLSTMAARIAGDRLASSPRLFGKTSYKRLAMAWRACRKSLGISNPTATLKSLRRRFARDRSVKGCPMPVLQQMLRHRDQRTTMEYLRLTGGYSSEEMRRWL